MSELTQTNHAITAKDLIDILKKMPPDSIIKFIIDVNSDNGDCQECHAKMIGLCESCKKFYQAHIAIEK